MAGDSEEHGTRREPINTRLWAMLVQQAKARFRVYPSLPASKWIHTEYEHRGGQFATSSKKNDRHDKAGHLTHAGKKELENEKSQDTRTGSDKGNASKRGRSASVRTSKRKVNL